MARFRGGAFGRFSVALGFSSFLWRRRVVRFLDVRVLNNGQKCKLSSMCNDGDEEHLVAGGHQGNAVEADIANRVHGMRSHLEDAIEGEFLIDEVEEVTPIPGIVFDDSMGIELDPEVESDEGQATQPACKSR